jgi:Subtilase family
VTGPAVKDEAALVRPLECEETAIRPRRSYEELQPAAETQCCKLGECGCEHEENEGDRVTRRSRRRRHRSDLKQADLRAAARVPLQGALVPGANFVTVGASPMDDHGHGTAVAGIIAARSNNKQGITGACWFCLVMPVKVLDRNGSGDDTQIAAGIVWAIDHGARVINLSLGGPGTTPELTAALAYAARKGVVVVAAAGNSGTTIPFYPAADPNALSVAATTSGDQPYNWTNFGFWVNVAGTRLQHRADLERRVRSVLWNLVRVAAGCRHCRARSIGTADCDGGPRSCRRSSSRQSRSAASSTTGASMRPTHSPRWRPCADRSRSCAVESSHGRTQRAPMSFRPRRASSRRPRVSRTEE